MADRDRLAGLSATSAGATTPDVIVVGGGPAGAAAAIVCAQQGLRVTLFEREAALWERPGDTMHPGVEPLLRQLGVAAQLPQVTGARHAGVWIEWAGPPRFQAFGSDANGAWLGYQVRRAEFDQMLLTQAQSLGVELRQSAAVQAPLLEQGRVCGVVVDGSALRARMVFDASGRSRWLARALGIASPASSQPLVARYGYVSGACPQCDDAPLLQGNADRWSWVARVAPGVYQWTAVALDGSKSQADILPPALDGLQPLGRTRGADVTWRLASQAAGPGWFLLGDAAALLDPSSSHGVLKGLMSGMAVAQLTAAILLQGAPEQAAGQTYQDWLGGWFAADCAQMSAFYQQLGVS